MLKVTRRTREVDVILNQQTAEDIARLGDALAEETTREQITEAGTNRQAKATAHRRAARTGGCGDVEAHVAGIAGKQVGAGIGRASQ